MSLSSSYFERMYAADPDPWSLSRRWYEERKYAVTLASLTRPRYRRGFEPGCSIGVLTAQLASRCDELLATDIVTDALRAAQERVIDQQHVEVRELAVPHDWPAGEFDLIVISELAYYLSPTDLCLLVDRAGSALAPDGDLVVVHWRHEVPGYPMAGDNVHSAFRLRSGLELIASHEEADFRLDLLGSVGRQSVAACEGLV